MKEALMLAHIPCSPTRRVVRLLGLVFLVAVFIGALAGAPAASASPSVSQTLAALRFAVDQGAIVQLGHDAVVAENQSANAVVAIGGNVYVHGTVTTAVAVGGNVIVDGRVNRTIVAIGGNVDLQGGWVGATNSSSDTAIVLVGGKLNRGPGSVLTGNVTNVKGTWFSDVFRFGVWNPVAHPYSLQAAVPWVVQTVLFALFAIIVTATMPRQVGAVARQLRRRTLASFGWGALGSFIVIPVSLVILTITIVGLLLVVPGVILGLPLTFLFVGTAVAVAVGGLLLHGSGQRGNLMLAGLIGVAILSVLRFVPFFGSLAIVLAWFFGLGALVLAVAEWQRSRREMRRAAREGVPGGGRLVGPSASPQPSPPAAQSGPAPSVWQTAPQTTPPQTAPPTTPPTTPSEAAPSPPTPPSPPSPPSSRV
jgi:hypothetical protein